MNPSALRDAGYAEGRLMRLVLVLGALIGTLGCATTATGSDAPWVGPLTFSPPAFSIGQTVKLSFEYRNIRGGLSKSQVNLDYRGSLPNHTRNRLRMNVRLCQSLIRLCNIE